MGLALFKERRLANRRRLTGLLPGRLIMADDKSDVVCKLVDVSRNGMGIVMDREIDPGIQMILLVPDQPIVLQVAWTQPDFGKQDKFRYGLVAVDPRHDLEEEFSKAGCLK